MSVIDAFCKKYNLYAFFNGAAVGIACVIPFLNWENKHTTKIADKDLIKNGQVLITEVRSPLGDVQRRDTIVAIPINSSPRFQDDATYLIKKGDLKVKIADKP